MSHAVDVPITDLDAVEDGDLSTVSTLDANVLREDFEIDDGTATHGPGFHFQRDSLATRMKNSLAKLTSRTGFYTRVPKSAARNGIELRERRFTDADSFELSDDEFILKRQSDTLFRAFLDAAKRYSLYALVVALLIVVITLSVIISKRPKEDFKHSSKKKVLFNGTDTFYPTTILISLDGFHPHYISKELTPTLHSLLVNGYGAPYMKPSFPSSTFPNHWTMATGLYPESHGIVGNTFYDPKLKRQFINVIPEKSLDPVFWGGEPIWSTAEFNGIRSAIHMFPGSEVKFPSGNPTEFDKFNGSESLEIKTARIQEWLDRDVSKRPELILSYVPTIDTLGHKYGIKGEELEKGLRYVDLFIKNVTSSLEDRNLTDIVNLVIVSDHGMAPTSEKRLIYLDEILNTTKIQYVDGWPLYGLRPYPEYSVDEVYNEAMSNFKDNSGYKIYLKKDLPDEFDFGGELTDRNKQFYDRIAPMWVIPDVGYSITTHDDMERKKGVYRPKGVHGYNNSEVLMRAIFLGQGPFFKARADEKEKAFKIKPFQNIELYGILCETLNIQPAANNGSVDIFSKNHLPKDWKDEFSYPDVSFDIDGILKFDSTYDMLFRSSSKHTTTTLKPEKDVTSSKIEETHEESSTNKGEPTNAEIKEETLTTTFSEKTETNTKAKEPTATSHKDVWGFLENIIEDIEEEVEEGLSKVEDWIEGHTTATDH